MFFLPYRTYRESLEKRIEKLCPVDVQSSTVTLVEYN